MIHCKTDLLLVGDENVPKQCYQTELAAMMKILYLCSVQHGGH